MDREMSAKRSGRRPLQWGYFGRVRYGDGVALQERLREELRAGRGSEALLLLEHPHVYTLGRSARRSELLAAGEWLAARGVEVHECDRGGRVTYHGPGQLVGYPILDLTRHRQDLHWYLRSLEEVLIRTLATYGTAAGRSPGYTGVWVENRKIASIGVHVTRWITFHGFALNVTTDLSDFDLIVPCGIQRVEMTSIEKETGVAHGVAEVGGAIARYFGEVFGLTMKPVSRKEML